MRRFYFTGSIIFSVLILIIAFENIMANCSGIHFLFFPLPPSVSPTFAIMGISIIGIITGVFYFGFINTLVKKEEEEEE